MSVWPDRQSFNYKTSVVRRLPILQTSTDVEFPCNCTMRMNSVMSPEIYSASYKHRALRHNLKKASIQIIRVTLSRIASGEDMIFYSEL